MSPKVVAVCFQGLARRSHGVRRYFVRGSREISLMSSLHRVSTDALIKICTICRTETVGVIVQFPFTGRVAFY